MSISSVQDRHRNKAFLINGIIAVCVLVVAAVFALNYVKVPYTVEESYPVEEAYEDVEFYNGTETYEVLVPSIEYITNEKEISISTPSDHLEPGSSTRGDQDCQIVPYNFTVNYSAPASERNTYDPISKAGYYQNAVRVMAVLCNEERHSLSTDLLVCDYAGNQQVDCNDHLKVTVPANRCYRRVLVWITAYDPQKTIRLEMGQVSSKIICKTKYTGSGKDAAEYSVVSYLPYAGHDYKKYTQENVRLKTKSGYLATPKNIAGYSYDEVESARQTDVTDVVRYKTETRERPIPLNRSVSKTHAVEKTRTRTEYRTLDEELLARFEAWCAAKKLC